LTALHSLTLEDRARFEDLLRRHGGQNRPLASYSFAYHFIWREMFCYEWTELQGHTCLFATNADGTFLALPPLGPDPCTVFSRVFDLLHEKNGRSGISRIENLPWDLAEQCQHLGYRVEAKAGDYIYLQGDLAGLKGNRYKSQRAAYNQCDRQAVRIRDYRDDEAESCIRLFENWRTGIPVGEQASYVRQVAADAMSAHRVALRHASELGLIGVVAEVEGRLAAYSFGYPINPSVFCIMLEISDRNIPGLSAYIFREFCRALAKYRYINTMDDSGIEGLQRAKWAYRPIEIVKSHTVTIA
jgi:hypothetical protein